MNVTVKVNIYFEKATKFCEIFTLLLSYVVPVKSKVKISQTFVAFSEYMNFIQECYCFRKIFLKDQCEYFREVGACALSLQLCVATQ
jgi:hypothetical protein